MVTTSLIRLDFLGEVEKLIKINVNMFRILHYPLVIPCIDTTLAFSIFLTRTIVI